MRRVGLAGHLSAFATVVVVAFALISYFVQMRHESRLIDRLADARMEAALQALATGSCVPPEVHVARPTDETGRIPTRLRALGPGRHLLGDERQFERVVVRDVDAARVLVSYGDAAHLQRLQDTRRAMLMTAIACIAAAAVLARLWVRALLAGRPSLARRLASRPAAGRVARTDERRTGSGDLRSRLALAYVVPPGDQGAMLDREREFIANVGHELRTPITMIATTCELLLDGQSLSPKARAAVQRMANAAEHMSDSVHSFLILARDGHLGKSETVGLLSCVLEALAPHRGALDERGVAVRVNVGAEVTVNANHEALFVVVNNLVKNAVKYTDRGGISVHHFGDTLYVADTGCGIPDGELSNVFLPFYRTRWAAASGRDGLGLGLAIVKRICDHYGWTVDVRSTEGQGTTVSIEFRRAPSLFR